METVTEADVAAAGDGAREGCRGRHMRFGVCEPHSRYDECPICPPVDDRIASMHYLLPASLWSHFPPVLGRIVVASGSDCYTANSVQSRPPS
ncbi:hypothetical protein [Allorhodopirellula heiligendammensis]|uniref:hypothetical protein n=1 Tax=Allorhodopirellula heiligendammensis TaxID=2714739 RepID=UPI0011B357CB|nr:hypothetical protein [Allorhodopirellula heiligendammensis]